MKTPVNPFKQALAEGRSQIGFWLALGSTTATEICATAGFDWLLIDGEHAPLSVPDVLHQAQAIAAYPGVHAVARVPEADVTWVKRYLDVGVRNLLVPMVESAAQAQQMVAAMRYPQAAGDGGLRGMAGARASRWGLYGDYATAANAQVCLLVQVESAAGLQALDEIAATDGVDGVFIGPADLSASLGYPGQAGHPAVQRHIDQAIARIRKAGKAAGILSADPDAARRYLSMGAQFVAVGLDIATLARHTRALAQAFKPAREEATGPAGQAGGSPYQ